MDKKNCVKVVSFKQFIHIKFTGKIAKFTFKIWTYPDIKTTIITTYIIFIYNDIIQL